MNYRQQLIHEAVQELKADPVWAPRLAHVTDIGFNHHRNAHDSEYWMVYKGTMTILSYTWGYYFHGKKTLLEKDSKRRAETIDRIKESIRKQIAYAEQKDSLNRRGLSDIYPGLAL